MSGQIGTGVDIANNAGLATKEYVNENLDFLFNNLQIPIGAEPSIPPTAGEDEIQREIGNVFFDTNVNLWRTTWTGSLDPLVATDLRVYTATSPTGEPNTWTKEGTITSVPTEDPYILMVGNTYRLSAEMRTGGLRIGSFTGTDINNLVYQGDLLTAVPGTAYASDVSSPIEKYRNGVYYLFFEGRNTSSFTLDGVTYQRNDGAIFYATSLTGLPGSYTVQNNGKPIISGYQMGNKTWFTHCVSDDLIFINNKWRFTIHAYNRDTFVTAVFESETLDSDNWTDALNTWVTIDGSNNDYAGQGIMLFRKDRSIYAMHCYSATGGIYFGKLNIRSTDKWYYSVQTDRDNSLNTDNIVGKSRNQIIDAPIPSNRTFVFVSDLSTASGVNIIINNTSVYELTVQPTEGVTFNGGTDSILIPANSSGKFTTTDVDTWVYEPIANINVLGTKLNNLGYTELYAGDLNTLPIGNYVVGLSGVVTNAPSGIGTPRSLINFGARNSSDSTLVGQIVIGSSGMAYRNTPTSTWSIVSSKTYVDNLLALKADLVGGKVPAAQLPSYVDDVEEYADFASFPVTGESGKIYVAIDINKQYRWSGSIYIEYGNPVTILKAVATLNFPSTPVGGKSDLLVNVPGAVMGEAVTLGIPHVSIQNGGTFTAWVDKPDSVTIRFLHNDPVNPIDPPEGIFTIKVLKD